MNKEEKNIVPVAELQAEQLELVVSEKTIGSLTTNAKEIRELVKSALPKYDISNYSTDDVAKAKADKALLNKAQKTLNDKRIAFEKEFMAPFGEFKEVVTETCNIIKEAVKKIDTVIKEDEERSKTEKRNSILALPEVQEFEALGLSIQTIWNDKWLNKTTSLKAVSTEIAEKTKAVKTDLETLKSFAEDYDVLVVRYKESLNLNDTVAYANQLKAQREATKAAEAAKEETSANTPSEQTSEAPAGQQEAQTESPAPSNNDAEADAMDAFAAAMGVEVEAPVQEQKPVIITRTYVIEARDFELHDLEDYLVCNGITFTVKD